MYLSFHYATRGQGDEWISLSFHYATRGQGEEWISLYIVFTCSNVYKACWKFISAQIFMTISFCLSYYISREDTTVDF